MIDQLATFSHLRLSAAVRIDGFDGVYTPELQSSRGLFRVFDDSMTVKIESIFHSLS